MIPQYVYKVAKCLEDAGFEAYLVGGSLRNLLMGIEPKDFDLTTNALPDQMAEIFPRSVLTGAKYGTVTALIENENGELMSVEVTTFRVEKEYFGGRWPSEVEFTRKLEEDLKRRDFTVNALALKLENYELGITNSKKLEIQNPELKNKIIDLFGGLADLENKVLKAVGDPIERFREDGLRSLRACRLASVYGFTIEEKTFDAIKETLEVAAQVSMERARDEFTKLILSSPKPSVGIELMRKAGLLELYIPELLEGYGMDQNEHHVHDVYQHALDTVDVAPPEVRFAALFHDIGKSRTKEGGHFYGHDREGAEMTRKIMTRLKFPKREIEDTVNLVRWHMFYVPTGQIKNLKFPPKADQPLAEENVNTSQSSVAKNSKARQLNQSTNQDFNVTIGTPNYHDKVEQEKAQRKAEFDYGWSDNAVRRMIQRVGGQEQIDKLIKLRIADAVANPHASFDPEAIRRLAERVAQVRQQDSIMTVKDLKISGHDLRELGIETGPKMKVILEDLLEMVLDDIELNTKEKLLEIVKNDILKES